MRRHDQEPRHVVIGVLDAGAEHGELVDLGGQRRGDRGDRLILQRGDVARGARGVGPELPLQSELLDDLAALAEGGLLADHGLDRGEGRAFDAQKLMAHAVEMLAQDKDRRFGQQVMDVGDAAVERILDRDQAEIDAALADGGKRVLERGCRHRLAVGQCLPRGGVTIRAGLALEDGAARLCDGGGDGHGIVVRETEARR